MAPWYCPARQSAPHGDPFEVRMLKLAVADIEKNFESSSGASAHHVQGSLRPQPNPFRLKIAGQLRRTAAAIERAMRRPHDRGGHRLRRSRAIISNKS
jgi:hypothetical protein